MQIKTILFLMIFAVFFAAQFPASDAFEYCVNSTTRYWQQDIYNASGGGLILSLNTTEPCSYGCDGGKCAPTRSNDPVAFAIMFGMAAFVFIYAAMNINQKHALLSWMFLPLGMLMLFVGIMSITAAGAYNDGMASLLGWTGYGVFVVILFLIFYFLIATMSTLMKKMHYGKKGSGGDYGK